MTEPAKRMSWSDVRERLDESLGEAGVPREDRAEHVLPRDRVGAVPAGDRVVTGYSGGREPVTYGKGAIWIVVGVLVVLFLVFFGSFLLFFR